MACLRLASIFIRSITSRDGMRAPLCRTKRENFTTNGVPTYVHKCHWPLYYVLCWYICQVAKRGTLKPAVWFDHNCVEGNVVLTSSVHPCGYFVASIYIFTHICFVFAEEDNHKREYEWECSYRVLSEPLDHLLSSNDVYFDDVIFARF